MITFKTISPKAFNVGALEKELKKAQGEWMGKVIREYQGTTKYWKHKVAFFGRGVERGFVTTIEIGTDDEIYGYVDEGTRPHIIRPKKFRRRGALGRYIKTVKVLAFPSVSAPKTNPGSLKSGKGKSGGLTIFAREVHHPGGKARRFSKQIKKKMEPVLETDMQNAMGRGAKKSGHAI